TWVAPSTVAIGNGECSISETQRLDTSGGGVGAGFDVGLAVIVRNWGNKLQAPGTKGRTTQDTHPLGCIQRNSKLQPPNQATNPENWKLVVGSFSGAWMLVLEVSLKFGV